MRYDYSNIPPMFRDYDFDFTYPMEFHKREMERDSVEYCVACIKACAHSIAYREAEDAEDALMQASCINDMVHELEWMLEKNAKAKNSA